MDHNSEPKIPNPEEIQRDFETFMRNKYGNNIHFFVKQETLDDPDLLSKSAEPTSPVQPEPPFNLNFEYKPKAIKQYLDRFVIKQDEAKKALAIAVCDHYHHVWDCTKDPTLGAKNYAKQNVLLLGPTGVGKTYLVRLIAQLIGVPFVRADATRFSETGYVGANVDDMVRELVAQANGNIEQAQYGIIYLDEADKLASKSQTGGRDVSGRGVQFGLLKLMEETEVNLRGGHDIPSQIQALIEFQKKGKVEPQVVNTRHILFIVSGAFHGMEEIIAQRLHHNAIGIGASLNRSSQPKSLLAEATTKDFIDYGFEPEFVGRLPVRVTCEELSHEDLYNVMKYSEGSLIWQYERAFRAYGIELVFSEGAYRAIAVAAALEKTGARGLLTILERVLRDYKFELPSTPIKALVVTEEMIQNPKRELRKLLDF